MDTCPACNANFTEPTVTGLCPACETEDAPSPKPTGALLALGLSAVPFFSSFTASTSSTSFTHGGNTVTSVSGMDYIAVGAGGAGAVLGAIFAVSARKAKDSKGAAIALGALVLGAFHVARGLFLF